MLYHTLLCAAAAAAAGELYGIAVMAFGFFISTLFKDHQSGQSIMFFAWLMFLGGYCGIAASGNANSVPAWIASLTPYIAGPLGIHRFIELESEVHNGRGLNWGDLMHGSPPLLAIWLICLVESVGQRSHTHSAITAQCVGTPHTPMPLDRCCATVWAVGRSCSSVARSTTRGERRRPR